MDSKGPFEQIKVAQARLYRKLVGLDLRSSGISEYQQMYSGSKLVDLKAYLELPESLASKRENQILVNFLLRKYRRYGDGRPSPQFTNTNLLSISHSPIQTRPAVTVVRCW